MKKIIYFFVAAIVFMSACANKNESQKKELEAKAKAYKETTNPTEKIKAKDAYIAAVEAFVSEFPQDTNCPNYLLNAAEAGVQFNDLSKSITLFEKIYTAYPEYKQMDVVILRTAILYDTQQDSVKAKEYYNLFIKNYPNHPNVIVAQQALQLMGKDLLEITKGLKESNE